MATHGRGVRVHRLWAACLSWRIEEEQARGSEANTGTDACVDPESQPESSPPSAPHPPCRRGGTCDNRRPLEFLAAARGVTFACESKVMTIGIWEPIAFLNRFSNSASADGKDSLSHAPCKARSSPSIGCSLSVFIKASARESKAESSSGPAETAHDARSGTTSTADLSSPSRNPPISVLVPRLDAITALPSSTEKSEIVERVGANVFDSCVMPAIPSGKPQPSRQSPFLLTTYPMPLTNGGRPDLQESSPNCKRHVRHYAGTRTGAFIRHRYTQNFNSVADDASPDQFQCPLNFSRRIRRKNLPEIRA